MTIVFCFRCCCSWCGPGPLVAVKPWWWHDSYLHVLIMVCCCQHVHTPTCISRARRACCSSTPAAHLDRSDTVATRRASLHCCQAPHTPPGKLLLLVLPLQVDPTSFPQPSPSPHRTTPC